MTHDDPRNVGDDPAPRKKVDPPQVQSEQPADDPRGDDEICREFGAGDGDDPPPLADVEPLRGS